MHTRMHKQAASIHMALQRAPVSTQILQNTYSLDRIPHHKERLNTSNTRTGHKGSNRLPVTSLMPLSRSRPSSGLV